MILIDKNKHTTDYLLSLFIKRLLIPLSKHLPTACFLQQNEYNFNKKNP